LASVELSVAEHDSMNQARSGSFFAPPVHSFLSVGEMPYCTHQQTRIGGTGTGYEKDFVKMVVEVLEEILVAGCEISGAGDSVRYCLVRGLREQANCSVMPAWSERGDIDNLGTVGCRAVHLDTFSACTSQLSLLV
jgi:hypothetical protein